MPVATRSSSASSGPPVVRRPTTTLTTTTATTAKTKGTIRRKATDAKKKSFSKQRPRPSTSTKTKSVSSYKEEEEEEQPQPQTPTPQNNEPPPQQCHRPWYHVYTKADAEYDTYMATEWSYEVRGDQALFERLCLEGAQAGLSWRTILRKRQAYRRVFFQFDPVKVAQMTPSDVDRLLSEEPSKKGKDPARDSIIRHRGKIKAIIHNAKCLLQMQQQAQQDKTENNSSNSQHGVFDALLWSFVNDQPILNYHALPDNHKVMMDNGAAPSLPAASVVLRDFPTQSPESQAMSRTLKERYGFKFVGPTTCYSLMQAVGMVLDHPLHTPEWYAAQQRLKQRPKGYQDRKPPKIKESTSEASTQS